MSKFLRKLNKWYKKLPDNSKIKSYVIGKGVLSAFEKLDDFTYTATTVGRYKNIPVVLSPTLNKGDICMVYGKPDLETVNELKPIKWQDL